MVNHDMVIEALKEVMDPELHQDVVSLNMVRNVDIHDNSVRVEIALTVQGCPLHQKITQDVESVLYRVDGIHEVKVDLSVMNDEERRVAFSRAFRAAEATRNQAKSNQKGAATATMAPPSNNSQMGRPQIGPLPGQAPAAGMMSDQSPTTVIGIASGKGGVGKSTVTANIAVALQRLGNRVGVMDMDIYGFSQGRMFGAKGQARVNEQEKIIPWNVHGISLVSMGMFVEETQAIVWRGPMLGKMMQQFFSDVFWPELDYLLVDLPPGTGDVALDIAQKVRKAKLVIVTTPQSVASQVAHRAADVAKRAHQEIIGVIENMSYARTPGGDKMEIFGAGGGQALASDLEVPLLGQVPLESTVREGGDEGRPTVLSAPESEASQVFMQIAQQIIKAVGR